MICNIAVTCDGFRWIEKIIFFLALFRGLDDYAIDMNGSVNAFPFFFRKFDFYIIITGFVFMN